MKTDRELLELAAKAAGFKVIGAITAGVLLVGLAVDDGKTITAVWAPHYDDGQALRLAVKLNINFRHMRFLTPARTVQCGIGLEWLDEIPCEADPFAATRRAVVLVAAAIAEAMP